MIKHLVLSALLISLLSTSYAQVTLKEAARGQHRLMLTYSPQRYFNGVNISGYGPANPVSTQNTWGQRIGVEYRLTKRGLILGGSIGYGTQRNVITTSYGNDLSWFDRDADHPEQLQNVSAVAKTYAFTSKYADLQLIVGYSFKLPAALGKGWRLETTFGVSSRLYLNNANPSLPAEDLNSLWWKMDYYKAGTYQVLTVGEEFGSWSYKNQFTVFEKYELYIGINKATRLAWLHNVALGAEIGKTLFNRGGTANLYHNTLNVDQALVGQHVYNAKDLSVGLKLSVGL